MKIKKENPTTPRIVTPTVEQLNTNTLPKLDIPRVKRIEELTEEQRELLPVWRDEWIKIGLCTEPANRPLAEAGIRACYRLAGFAEPESIVWCASPLAAVTEGPKLAKAAGSKSNLEWTQYLGGQFWAGGWYYGPAGASFAIDACGLELEPNMELRFRALQAVTMSACWWWLSDKVCTVSERPYIISRDPATGRLHNPKGPAIAWKDGFEEYRWRGAMVPKEWIEGSANLDPKVALTHQNVELRRIAAEIIGWSRVLASVPNRVIDTDPDPQIGKLLEVDLPDAPGSKFLEVRCGTGRTFCLPVPDEMTTALQANAWTYGLEEASDLEQFRSYEVRT